MVWCAPMPGPSRPGCVVLELFFIFDMLLGHPGSCQTSPLHVVSEKVPHPLVGGFEF
jgi:hypothetical protein